MEEDHFESTAVVANEQDSLRESLLPTNEEEISEGREQGQSLRRPSRNVPVTLWFTGLRAAGEAIWYYSVLTAYVFVLKPENPGWIGYLSSIEGVAQFFAAALTGILADNFQWRRDGLLRVTFFIGITASTLTFLSSYYRAGTDLWWWSLVAVAPCLWGIFDGIGLTASLALFADSIQDGHRSYYFTIRTVLMTGGSIGGPLVALAMFAFLGDHWTIADCSKVICTAQFLLIPAFLLLWWFNDDDIPTVTTLTSTSRTNADLGSEETEVTNEEQTEDGHLLEQGQATSSNPEPVIFLGLFIVSDRDRFIAVSAAVSDIICSIAQGVAFRYYALFLLNDLQMHPVIIQVLDATTCIVSSVLLFFTQRLSLRFARCPVVIFFKLIGVLWLITMTVLPTIRENTSTLSPSYSFRFIRYSKPIVCALYVLQNAFLQSTGALTRSLVMDHAPPGERSKWSALESINIFGFCGSAAIGGILVEKMFHGRLLPVFWVTAVLQVVGLVPLIPIIKLEPMEQEMRQD